MLVQIHDVTGGNRELLCQNECEDGDACFTWSREVRRQYPDAELEIVLEASEHFFVTGD